MENYNRYGNEFENIGYLLAELKYQLDRVEGSSAIILATLKEEVNFLLKEEEE